MIGAAQDSRMWRIVFTDMTLLLLLTLVTVIVVLLKYFHPPGEEADAYDPPGSLIADIRWPGDRDVDVDLWVKPPKGGAIGYSRKGSEVMDLLRDDLGHLDDIGALHMETAFSRTLPPGEWIVNVQIYNLRDHAGPVPIDVTVRRKHPNEDRAIDRIAEKRVVLSDQNEEKTAVRFRLDKAGLVVPNSINDRCVQIRDPELEGMPC
jgi:hypothetical protein